MLEVFGQSEQTALVGRRDFVENDSFERGGVQRTYNNVQYLKNNLFFYIKACQHILLHQIHKIMIFKIASYDPL